MHLLQDGGPMFMWPILIILLLTLFLFVKCVLAKDDRNKGLINQLGSVALIWGVIGTIIGLIGAFDAIEAIEGVAPAMVAGGLKVALLSTLFGLITCFISRLCTLILSFRP